MQAVRALVVTVLLAACGESGVSLDDLPEELGRVQCAFTYRCCTAQEIQDMLLPNDEEDCRTTYEVLAPLLSKPHKDSVSKGRVDYDPDLAEACISKMEMLPCTEVAPEDRSFADIGCESPFVPKVALGDECASDEDCISTWCKGESISSGDVFYGACIEPPGEGMPCDQGDCADGFYCDSEICARTLADGAPCLLDSDCTSGACNGSPRTCGPRMTCDGL